MLMTLANLHEYLAFIDIGHLSKACYYKNVGVSKGKFKSIPKDHERQLGPSTMVMLEK